MADRAPGYEEVAEDLQCYNCGIKGHMFFACPEDTRRVPAGLEASRKRQALGSDYYTPTKRSRGPVVTHYPPPPGLPHISPPPTTYSPRPGYEGYQPGPPPGPPIGPPHHQPPQPSNYDQYPPPPNTGQSVPRGFSYSHSREMYDHHFHGTAGPPPSEVSYIPPHYDRYEKYHSNPSPSSHDRPYSAPDPYNERSAGLARNSPYAPPYRTSHQAHPEYYPPAPGVDSYYPSTPLSYPPPHLNAYPNSSHYGYNRTSTARLSNSTQGSSPPVTRPYQSYQYPPSDPPPYHAHLDDRFADRSSYDPRRRDTHQQHTGHRSGQNRQHRESYGRRMRHDSPNGRSRSERRSSDRAPRLPSSIRSTSPTQPAKDLTASEDSEPQKDSSSAVTDNHKTPEKYIPEDFAWEEEMIFKELPAKFTRDLIKEPLPADWTDAPIMPPKYDKETITSKYINPTNVDDFALSVRETKAWQAMQHHPAFLPYRDVRPDKLLEYERALNLGPAYNKYNRHSTDSSGGKQRVKLMGSKSRGGRQTRYSQYPGQNYPTSDKQFHHVQPESTKRSWDQTDYRDSEEPEGERKVHGKKQKLSSPEPGEVCEADDQESASLTESTSPRREQESYVCQNREGHIVNAPRDARDIHPRATLDSNAHRSPPRAPLTPPLRSNLFAGSPPHVSDRPNSQDGPGRLSSRHSFKSNDSEQSSSIGSPLTPTERELLGMRPYSSGSDAEQQTKAPQVNGAPTRPRQRPAKLDAAYQRRW